MKPDFFNSEFLNNLSRHLSDALPDSVHLLKKDLENNFRAVLQSAFSRLDLVTREEFDTQTRVLARAHKRLAKLEKAFEALEQKHANKQK